MKLALLLLLLNFSLNKPAEMHIFVPQNTSRQTVYCSTTELQFPPFQQSVRCYIETKTYEPEFEGDGAPENSYTRASEEIYKIAESLDAGNAFTTAIKVAEWIRKNIAYDESLGDVELKATDVLKVRKGTCDEFTNLFIAMMNSIGYETRYVSGFAFTNNTLVPHAWAEVKTRFGWLPIDITFKEYGWLDAYHIELRKGEAGNSSIFEVKYRGEKPEINYTFSGEVLDIYGEQPVNIEVKAFNTTTDGDVLFEVKIKNMLVTPIALPVEIQTPKNIKMVKLYGKNLVIVYPNQSKKLYYVFSLLDLKKGYAYRIPSIFDFQVKQVNVDFVASGESGKIEFSKYPDRWESKFPCVDLETGDVTRVLLLNHPYFCKNRFVLPTGKRIPVSYSLSYPKKCFEVCMLKIKFKGFDYVKLKVDGETFQIFVNESREIKFNLLPGTHEVCVNENCVNVSMQELPKPFVNVTVNGFIVEFKSNWEIKPEEAKIFCGRNYIPVNLTLDNFTLQRIYVIEKKCSVLEKVINALEILKAWIKHIGFYFSHLYYLLSGLL